MPTFEDRAERRDRHSAELEASQAELRKSISETERLVDESEQMARRHRDECEAGDARAVDEAQRPLPGTNWRNRRSATVPRFYFHLHNDMDVPDEEGVELANLEDARAHALREARNLFAQNANEQGRVTLTHRIDIEDERGAVLGTVRFGDAVRVEA